MDRKVTNIIKGYRAVDGNNVKLFRVLGYRTIEEFDPFLMLDSFDSNNYEDYKGGFPMHPHRGIETFTYIAKGRILHKDSLGFKDEIQDGEVQWMTAGSGILHEEALPEAERLVGIQLWLNLPSYKKMVDPEYHPIKKAHIQNINLGGGILKLIAGRYGELKGHEGKYQPLDFYQIEIEPESTVEIETDAEKSAFVFILEGEASIDGVLIEEKNAAKLSQGNNLRLSTDTKGATVLYGASIPIKEPVAWGGPIVMNSEAELDEAFRELSTGEFLKVK